MPPSRSAGLLPVRCARRPPRLRRAGRREPPTRAATCASCGSCASSTATAPSSPLARARRDQDVRFTGDGSHVVVVTSNGSGMAITSFGGAEPRVLTRTQRGALSIYPRPSGRTSPSCGRSATAARRRCWSTRATGRAVDARHRRRDAGGLRPGRPVDPRGGRPQLGRRRPRRRPGARRAAAARRRAGLVLPGRGRQLALSSGTRPRRRPRARPRRRARRASAAG